MMMPFCAATPNSATKPTAAAVFSASPVTGSNRAAQRGERHDTEDKQRLTQHAELALEQRQPGSEPNAHWRVARRA
jgi:hypothetical protein